MRAPIRPLEGRWPAFLQRRAARFFWVDPRVVLDDAAPPAEFRRAMAAFAVGQTIKITGSKRHPAADAMLVNQVDVSRATIVDLGASDGSTSLDLIAMLPAFGSYVIADLFFEVSASQVGKRTVFFDSTGTCILVVGRRTVAWPTRSKVVGKMLASTIEASRHAADKRDVVLLNPEVRAMIAADARVSYAVHDVFEPWPGPPPDVIKIANLLRRLYFDDAQLSQALTAVLNSLPEGGHLLIVDNPRIADIAERAGLYRREGGRFRPVDSTPESPEIDDLIRLIEAQVDAAGDDAGRAAQAQSGLT